MSGLVAHPVDHGNSIRYNSIGSPTLNISGIQFEMYFMQSRNLLCEWSQLKHTEIGCAIHLFNNTTIPKLAPLDFS